MNPWDEIKRATNIKQHGIDFADLTDVFDHPMVTVEDDRVAYGEMRLQSLCWHNKRVVFMVWTECEDDVRLISCRYGDKHETRKYFKAIGY